MAEGIKNAQNLSDFGHNPSDLGQNPEDFQSYGPGWRTEFRPLEVQLTDFENAAFALLVVLLAKSIIAHAHSFYVPMSLVHENMRRAQLKDAVLTQKFWFRRNALQSIGSNAEVKPLLDDDVHSRGRDEIMNHHDHQRVSVVSTIPSIADIDLVELSMDEIMNGEKGKAMGNSDSDHANLFQGIIPHIRQTLRSSWSAPSSPSPSIAILDHPLDKYLNLLSDRASGRLPTAARWMRNYVSSHPLSTNRAGDDDNSDCSVVAAEDDDDESTISRKIIDDLLVCCEGIGMGSICCPALYGNHSEITPLDAVSEEELARLSIHTSPHDDDSHHRKSYKTHNDGSSGKHHGERAVSSTLLSSLSPSSSPCIMGADANNTYTKPSTLDV